MLHKCDLSTYWLGSPLNVFNSDWNDEKKKKEKKKEEERIKNVHIIYQETLGSGNVGAACKVFADFFF